MSAILVTIVKIAANYCRGVVMLRQVMEPADILAELKQLRGKQ